MRDKIWKCGSLIFAICVILIACYPFIYDYLESRSGLNAYGVELETALEISGKETGLPELTTPELVPGIVYRQDFLSPCEQIFSIRVFIITYLRTNLGVVKARLLDAESGQVLLEWQRDAEEFENNSYAAFSCTPLPQTGKMKGHAYAFEIWAEKTGVGNGISLHMTEGDAYPEGECYQNGEEQDGDLCFKVIGLRDEFDYRMTRLWLRIYLAVGLEIVLGCLWLKIRTKKEKTV